MTTSIIIVLLSPIGIMIICCFVIPLVLLTVYGTVRTSYTDKKRKVYEEQEKIRTYGDQINEETRKNINEKKKFIY